MAINGHQWPLSFVFWYRRDSMLVGPNAQQTLKMPPDICKEYMEIPIWEGAKMEAPGLRGAWFEAPEITVPLSQFAISRKKQN